MGGGLPVPGRLPLGRGAGGSIDRPDDEGCEGLGSVIGGGGGTLRVAGGVGGGGWSSKMRVTIHRANAAIATIRANEARKVHRPAVVSVTGQGRGHKRHRPTPLRRYQCGRKLGPTC